MPGLVTVQVAGGPLHCHQCKHDTFTKATFGYFGTWLPRVTFDCARCGFNHPFLKNHGLKVEAANKGS